MARQKRNQSKSNRVIRVVNHNNSQKTPQKTQISTSKSNNNKSGSRLHHLDQEIDNSQVDIQVEDCVLDNDGEIRPFNFSHGMDSIAEEDSDDGSTWTEVNSRSGANPPFKIIDGFVKRFWGYTEYDKISFYSNGIFIVRFKTEDMKLRVLQSEPLFFDNKHVVIKEWTPTAKLIRETGYMVPIWIRFYGLPLKFWGNALNKIAGLVGVPVRCDSNTQLKNFIGHARVMVEVKMGADLPNVIEFTDELDVLHRQIVHYEWKPVICTECKGVGHMALEFRTKQQKGQKQVRQKWVPKERVQRTTVVVLRAVVIPPPASSLRIQFRNNISLSRGFVTPIPVSSTPFSPARVLTKFTKQGGMSMGSGRRTFLEVLEHSFQYQVIEEEPWEQGLVIENGIWIIWDASNHDVEVLRSEAQVVHTRVTFLPIGKAWFLSMVYGFNRLAERATFWQSIKSMKNAVRGPWVVMGDFNNVDFQECVDYCGLCDIPPQVAFFTWTNKHEIGDLKFSRIDRTLVNDSWLIEFPNTITMYHPEGVFDHCPCTMQLTYELVKKLKLLKQPLKELNSLGYANIETTAQVALKHLHSVQMQLQGDPTNVGMQQAVKDADLLYKERGQALRSFLAQKAKAHWMRDGDDNTQYFHSVIKARRMQNRILGIYDMDGQNHTTSADIEAAFINYYKHLLGTQT
ncbi:uncharacterized protein LOC141588000 [Silene latifolia]|uniref:uncharacterized protein LOC141588000 n=1 Tax=Silene latifolia TaxID=37657 RepID=UPI003D76E93F